MTEINEEDQKFQKVVDLTPAEIYEAGRQKGQKSSLAVIKAAHFLLVWTHQEGINIDDGPPRGWWHINDLHPSVWNGLNSAERDLWNCLKKLDE